MDMDEILKIRMKDLSYVECVDCGNYFFVQELPMSVNDPTYCAYCGIEFKGMIDEDIDLL
jgi:hypothetical protein